jgi:hypothetical protein
MAKIPGVAAYFFVFLFFLGVYFYFYLKTLRAKKLAQVAKELGFAFTRKSNLRNDEDARKIAVLKGLFMTIYNSMTGKRGNVEINLFDIVNS